MMMLRDMGHEVNGPINGPNEGPPQYQIPRAWLEMLETQITAAPTPSPFNMPTRPTPSPDVLLVDSTHSNLAGTSAIDPQLLSNSPVAGPSYTQNYMDLDQSVEVDPNQNPGPDDDVLPFVGPAMDNIQSEGVMSPNQLVAETTGITENSVPIPPRNQLHDGSGTTLGKRNPALRSPPKKSQTRDSQRRKVVTRDDLAMLEAMELLKGGTGGRRKRRG